MVQETLAKGEPSLLGVEFKMKNPIIFLHMFFVFFSRERSHGTHQKGEGKIMENQSIFLGGDMSSFLSIGPRRVHVFF